MKKIAIIIAMLAVAAGMEAQTFYETAFVNPNDKKEYVGLMIYYGDDDCTMRFVNKEMLAKNQVAESNYTLGKEGKESADDVYIMYFIPEEENDFPTFAWTWKRKDGSDMSDVPMIIFGDDDPFKAEYFKEIDLDDMDEEYVGQFYSENEKEYQLMINGIQTVKDNDEDDDETVHTGNGKTNKNEEAEEGEYPTSGHATSYYAGNTSGENSDATLHLIFVANTKVSDIGATCERDVRNVSSEFSAIARALKMNYKQYDVSGDNYGLKAMGKTIDKVHPGKNDVLMFVYTGHGFRFDNQESKYPCIDLSQSDYDEIEGNYAKMSDVYRLITAKGARLSIILSDCCNSKIGQNSPIINNNSLLSRSNNNFDIKRLRTLFLGSEGNIWATAASPGEYSWCGSTGGFFLNSFIESLRKQISPLNTSEPSWTSVVNDAIASAKKKTSNDADTKPQNGLKTISARAIRH